MSTVSSLFIILITLGTLLGCLLLLLWCMKDKMGVEEGKSMGHSFDGIEELNNPLPRWWTYLFFILLAVGLLYLLLYPGLGNFAGLLGWQSSDQTIRSLDESRQASADARSRGVLVQYDREMARADAFYGEQLRQLIRSADGRGYRDITLLAGDPAALKVGQRLFLQNCAQCHGSDARGGKGFPNLTDSEWQWGGEPEQIKTTLLQGRQAVMPAWGDALGKEGVQEVVSYVLGLSGRKVDLVEAQKGQARFVACAACHGADAKGNTALGAPDLTNRIWLYGSARQSLTESITHGRNGVMPAWKEILGEDKVHLLAAYVYSLSHQPQ